MATDLVNSLRRTIGDLYRRRERSRLTIPTSEKRSPDPTVYFLTPDHKPPSGGIRVIYRHVDILNAAGMNAFVLHQRKGFSCDWFEHKTRITDVSRARIGQGDLLVVPEVDVDLLARVAPGVRHVIFNQSGHLTWRRETDLVARHYASSKDLVGVVVVSSHSEDLLRLAFPRLTIRRVHLGIDPTLFKPGAGGRAAKIAYMPRRTPDDTLQVLTILRDRGVLHGWELCPLVGLSHAQVAEKLRETKIFLSFTYQEGFGLPAAEAMACGNYVVGNHGFGGSEFFRPEFTSPVQSGDTMGFVRAVEQAIVRERETPGWCAERGAAASRFILEEYAPTRERGDVEAIYSEFMNGAQVSTRPLERA